MRSNWRKSLPMWFTLSRMILALPILGLMHFEDSFYRWIACGLFGIASITDYYDGYFARKFNAATNLGKFMDPVADKILVSAILVLLAVEQTIDPFMVVLIITRDTLIGGLRSVAAADQIVIDAKAAGKWKTALQMSAIPFLILGPKFWIDWIEMPVHRWAYGALWLSTVLSLTSGWAYYTSYLESAKAQKLKA